LNVTLESS